MAKLILLAFGVCIAWMTISVTAYDTSDTGRSQITNIRMKRNVIKTITAIFSKTKTWTLQLVRVVRARSILLADARLWRTDKALEVSWYGKTGGWARAERDFWAMGGCCSKLQFIVRENLDGQSDVSKYGTVGENAVELIKRFSDEFPYPAIFMYKKNLLDESSGNSILVLYKPTSKFE